MFFGCRRDCFPYRSKFWQTYVVREVRKVACAICICRSLPACLEPRGTAYFYAKLRVDR